LSRVVNELARMRKTWISPAKTAPTTTRTRLMAGSVAARYTH
jgi:hypothetical protein